MIPESKEDERKCHRKGDFAGSAALGSACSGLRWNVSISHH